MNRTSAIILGHGLVWTAAGLAAGDTRGAEPPAQPAALPLLTRAAQVRELSYEEARRGYPIRLQGVVTCFDTQWSLFFVQDASAGIYVFPAPQRMQFKAGQLVELEGVSDPGEFAPIVSNPRVKTLGTAPLPQAQLLSLETLLTGRQDSQWLEVRGVGRSIRYTVGRPVVKVASALGTFDAMICGGPMEVPPLAYVGARLRLQGVCDVIRNRNRQATGIRLLLPGASHIVVEEPAPISPLEAPLTAITGMSRFSPAAAREPFVHLSGEVTHRRGNADFFMRDDTGSIQVRVAPTARIALRVGDRVEAAGFPARGRYSPMLDDAVVRRLGPGPPPKPIPIKVEEALQGLYDGQLVQLRGELLEMGERRDRFVLVVRSGSTLFNVALEKDADAPAPLWPPPKSQVQVAGICTVNVNREQFPVSFNLALRGPADLVVVEPAPWWNLKHSLNVLGLTGGLALAALLWVLLLRRRVAEQTAVLRHRYEAENALQRRYQELVEEASDIIYTHDFDGNFTSVNQAAERLTGYSLAETPRLNIRQVVAPESLETALDNLQRQLKGEPTPAYELEIIAKDGSRKVIEVNAQLVCQDGQPKGVQGIGRDITERKGAEQALRQSEAKLRLSQRIGQVGSWELDLASETLTWSQEAYRIFGRQPAEFQPTRESFYAAIHPADRATVKAAVEKAVATRGQYSVDHRIVWPDGTQRFIHEQAEVIAEGNHLRLAGTAHDITDRRQLEEQFRQAQKMEAIGQLAGGIAHDFNNMLMVIQGHLGLMLGQPELPDSMRDPIVEMLQASGRAASLTRQLLAFSRRQVLQMKTLDLNEVTREVAKMLHPLLGETIHLELQFWPQPLAIEADAGAIEQIIMNLAVNARDAMPKGGRLTLTTTAANITAEEARKNSEATVGAVARLTVTDTGCGMDEATMARIFEPFFTTKELGKGTGLGLATVYGIVKQHQGWIEVHSAVGQGTTFKTYFPASSKSLEPPPPPIVVAAAAYHGQETILVVEDEPALRMLVCSVLKRFGYQVLEAQNGVEALAVWQQHRHQIRLLFTDLVMPEGCSGRELADQLQKDEPTLRVLYTSGYSLDWLAEGVRLQEGVNFLQKPYHPIKLGQVVRERLDSKAEPAS